MFETQSTDEWLPGWARRFRPFLIALIVTPIALVTGLPDWGPEGLQVYVGFIIFPYAALLYFAGAVTRNVGLLYVSLLLVLIQFPVYGILLSSFENARLAAKVVFLLHAGLALFILGIMLFVWTFRCLTSGC